MEKKDEELRQEMLELQMIEERLQSLIERYTLEIEDETKNLKKYKGALENVLKESDCLSEVDNSRICSLHRIVKKDYCKGFANGLEQQLEQSLIEMNLHPKYELAVVGVPIVVKEWANKKIKVTKSKSRYVTNEEAYKLGNQHGLEYKVKRTDLLENKKHGSAAT